MFLQYGTVVFWAANEADVSSLSEQVLRILMLFSTIYLCKAVFSLAVVIKAKTCNKLKLKNNLVAHFLPLILVSRC